MQQKESEFMLVGRIYATALYDAAAHAGKLSEVLTDIASLDAVLVAVPRLNMFLKAANISSIEKRKLVDDVFSGRLESLTRATLYAMARRDRLALLKEFLASFDLVASHRANRISMEVISSVAMNDRQQSQIRQVAGKAAGREVDLNLTVNPKLLGGVQFRLGDMLIDGSIRRRLQNMKSRLHASILTDLRQENTIQVN